MNKLYHLSSCSTCQAIIRDTGIHHLAAKGKFELQDIKTEKISAAQLDEMKARSGSYESLFSRRAIKYKEMGLKDMPLTENDYRRLILEEYTFLKRPVALVGPKIFIGNDKKNVGALTEALKTKG